MIPGLAMLRGYRRAWLAAAGPQAEPGQWFILNVEANVEVDFTALGALDLVRDKIVRRGGVFALARVKQDLLESRRWPRRLRT